MVLCLTDAYVTKVLCSSVTMSSKPVSSCLTQKPHPVRCPLSVGEGLGVRPYHESERTKLIH